MIFVSEGLLIAKPLERCTLSIVVSHNKRIIQESRSLRVFSLDIICKCIHLIISASILGSKYQRTVKKTKKRHTQTYLESVLKCR